MLNETKVYLSIINSLIESTTLAITAREFGYYETVRLEVNKLIDKIKYQENGNVFDFQELPKKYSNYYGGDLISALSVLNEMKAFLESVSGETIENVNQLKAKNETLQLQLNDASQKEKDYFEIIKRSRGAVNYPFDEPKLKLFKGNNFKLMNEALDSYSVGAYTACICICRALLESLVQELCKTNSVSEGTLKKQLEVLIEKKIIKEENHSVLLEVAKFYGIRAAHPTTEVIGKEKANLVLSSLFIINEELFNKSKS